METKELKIVAPEGYEIDRENSTLDCIKFVLVKNIDYKSVIKQLIDPYNYFYIGDKGEIIRSRFPYKENAIYDKNKATNRKQLKRILALNQLLNIAAYYNRNGKTDTNTYTIAYDADNDKFDAVFYNPAYVYSFGAVAVFNREEDAQTVIDNPNFREILDTIYKN